MLPAWIRLLLMSEPNIHHLQRFSNNYFFSCVGPGERSLYYSIKLIFVFYGWIESFQFYPGVLSSKLPINDISIFISMFYPSFNFTFNSSIFSNRRFKTDEKDDLTQFRPYLTNCHAWVVMKFYFFKNFSCMSWL